MFRRLVKQSAYWQNLQWIWRQEIKQENFQPSIWHVPEKWSLVTTEYYLQNIPTGWPTKCCPASVHESVWRRKCLSFLAGPGLPSTSHRWRWRGRCRKNCPCPPHTRPWVTQAFAGILIAHVTSSFNHQTAKVGQKFAMSKTIALQHHKGGVKSPHKFPRVKWRVIVEKTVEHGRSGWSVTETSSPS